MKKTCHIIFFYCQSNNKDIFTKFHQNIFLKKEKKFAHMPPTHLKKAKPKIAQKKGQYPPPQSFLV